MKLTSKQLRQIIKEELQQVLQEEMNRDQKTYQDMKKRNHPEEDIVGQTKISDKYGLNLNPLSSKYDLDTLKTKEIPFPSDKFTHGKLSGLRLHTGGGSSDSIVYKMHKTGQEFLNFLDQTIGDVYDVAGAFYNEEYIKSFGLVYGKEVERMLRAYIQHTDSELGHYNDNFGVEAEMRFGPEEY